MLQSKKGNIYKPNAGAEAGLKEKYWVSSTWLLESTRKGREISKYLIY